MSVPNRALIAQVTALADGTRSSVEIAEILGRQPRHIRKILQKYELSRRPPGAPQGEENWQFQGGRRMTTSGYIKISAPPGYPTAKLLAGKTIGWVWEHRYVLEQSLGRFLGPDERVDHIDGLTLHNAPHNLRVFASNAEHLKATITGCVPNWSEQGHQNMFLRHSQPEALERVDIHRQRTEAGATRLRQILLAALQLGIDSQYLLGTLHWPKQAGIDMSSRSTIERALADLCSQWAWPPPQ